MLDTVARFWNFPACAGRRPHTRRATDDVRRRKALCDFRLARRGQGAAGRADLLRGRADRVPLQGRVDPDVDLLAAERDDVRRLSAGAAGALVDLRAGGPARARRRAGAAPRAARDDVAALPE